MPKKNEITLKRTQLADASLLAEMAWRTFEAAFGPLKDPADIQAYLKESFSLDQIENELINSDSIFLLAFQEGEPIGYSKLILDKAHDCVKGEAQVELQRLYVETGAIGRGIGTKILQASFEEARAAGQKTIWLGVWEENRKAIRFYERHGFLKVCTQDFMLGSDLQTDWVMHRPL